jgi:F0F1-type ATP synthase membrane subunit b/b'
MPQFDKITFFTQIFWLFIIFFGFYFLTLRVFIPEIAAVLKTRKKKLALGSGGVAQFNTELHKVKTCTNSVLESSSDAFTLKVHRMLKGVN